VQPDLVARCDNVCAQLQSWTQALELGQAVSRPSPKELGLVRVESQSVGGHSSADIDNAVCQLSGCCGGVLVVTVQVQLRFIREGMEVTPCWPTRSATYIINNRGPSTDPCGTEQTMKMTDEVLPA